MTKDLALCISGGKNVTRDKYCSTEEFMTKVEDMVKQKVRNEYRAKL